MQNPSILRTAGLLALASITWAQEAPDPAFTLRGFGTVGVVRTSTDEAEFVRDISQPRGATTGLNLGVDSRLGLQVNGRVSEQLEFVIQGVAQRRYDNSFTPDLTWAFLKWAPVEGLDLRAGRLGSDLYLLADSRNIGYSYLWVRPPVDYYGSIPISHLDGADVVVKGPLGPGFGSIKLFAGVATEKVPRGDAATYDLSGSKALGGNVDYRIGPWWARAAFAQLTFKRELGPEVDQLLAALRDPAVAALSPAAPDLADELTMTHRQARYLSLGLVFEQGGLQSQLGFSRVRTQSISIPDSTSGYALLGQRWGAWTPFLTWSRTKTVREVRSTGLPPIPAFAPLQQGVDQLLSMNQNDQRTASFGLRWDRWKNVALKAQVDVVKAVPGATQTWEREAPGWNGRATVFTLSLDFVF